MPEPANTVRLSVSEAARLFGVDDRTIRRAIKAQEIAYIIVRGRYKINFSSMVQWSQKNARRQAKLTKEGIGQYVSGWRINNRLYSPSIPKELDPETSSG